MGITIENVIADQFKRVIECFKVELIENGNKTFCCQIDSCTQRYMSQSAAIRHIRQNHNQIYSEIQKNKNDKPVTDNSFNDVLEIRVKVSPKEIWKACVDLIAINAMPLCIVEYPAFKRILEPYIIALKRQSVDLVINRQNIKEKLEQRSKTIKNLIAAQVKNKMLSVMIDIASRYNRSVLGVSISYFHGGKLRVRTIGMHAIHFSQTAQNLKELIMKNLRDFNIRMEQVNSVTTDNGKNMLKTIALMNAELQGEQVPVINDDSDNEEYVDNTIFDETYYGALLDEVRSLFHEVNHTCLIHGISCAAHCINLVVTHAIDKTPDSLKIIGKCRELAKKLRCPTFRAMLRSNGYNMAILDVSTRWNSIYSMVIDWIILKKMFDGLDILFIILVEPFNGIADILSIGCGTERFEQVSSN